MDVRLGAADAIYQNYAPLGLDGNLGIMALAMGPSFRGRRVSSKTRELDKAFNRDWRPACGVQVVA